MACYGVLPPCIRGRQVALLDGGQVEMECLPDVSIPCVQMISEVSDTQLVQHLCRSGAVFSFTADGPNYCQVECLTPYNPVSSEVQAGASIVVSSNLVPSNLSHDRLLV